MENKDTNYTQKLVDTLRTKDPVKLRDFLRRSAEERDPERVHEIDTIPEDKMVVRMHKMIIARRELADLHAESRAWLAEHDQEVSF